MNIMNLTNIKYTHAYKFNIEWNNITKITKPLNKIIKILLTTWRRVM
jgi:hypothetical protein